MEDWDRKMKTSEQVFKNRGFLINRENRCCVCGSKKDLNRHHIIPSCYIKALDKKIRDELKKDHPYYYELDYCCTCGDCHDNYEINFGQELNLFIWEIFQVDLKKTSYKNPRSNYPKPSEVVMSKIKNKRDYINLREICIDYFVKSMKPEFDLI